jgi:hypothetical protein
VPNTDLWVKCGTSLKNLATKQYFFIDKDHNYQTSVQTAKSNDIIIFNHKYVHKYTVIIVKTPICNPKNGVCALTGQLFASEIVSTLFIAPLLKQNNPHLDYQEWTVIYQKKK